jgi:putative transposase
MIMPQRANERWILDFLRRSFTDGLLFRVLAVVNDYTRECLVRVTDTSRCQKRNPRLAKHMEVIRGLCRMFSMHA